MASLKYSNKWIIIRDKDGIERIKPESFQFVECWHIFPLKNKNFNKDK